MSFPLRLPEAGALVARRIHGAVARAAAAPEPSPLYRPPGRPPSASIPRVHLGKSAPRGSECAEFHALATELGPATLYGGRGHHLSFFTYLEEYREEYRLGGPTYAAHATRSGSRVVKTGRRWSPPRSGNWVLVWFAGAKGWTDRESRWVVYLENRSSAAGLDDAGLHFSFTGAAGRATVDLRPGDSRGRHSRVRTRRPLNWNTQATTYELAREAPAATHRNNP